MSSRSLSDRVIPFGRFALWTPCSPREVAERVATWGGGRLDDDTFDIELAPDRVGPRLLGNLEAADGGTYVAIRFGWDSTWIAGIVLAAAFLGPIMLVFLLFLYQGQQHTRQLLDSLIARDLGTVERGLHAERRRSKDALGDPTAEGAATLAPSGFAVRTTLDSAVFTLRGTRRPTTLVVSRQGLDFPRAKELGRVEWSTIVAHRVEVDHIVIERAGHEPIRIDVARHPPHHVQWLADFLQARHARYAATPDEARRARAQLAAVKAGRSG